MLRRSMGMLERVVVYGGNGGLGRAIVSHMKAKDWHVYSVDFSENSVATGNVVLEQEMSAEAMSTKVRDHMADILGEHKLDGIVNVAGGWAGGSIKSKDILATTDLMWRQSVHSSLICGQLAVKHLADCGIVVLPGAAAAAAGPTGGMLGYGVAKAAVHHIIASIADEGLPKDSCTVGLLPVTLDTEMNRKFMTPTPSWTPLSHVAEVMDTWISTPATRPRTGSLVRFDTQEGKTSLIAMDISSADRPLSA